MTSKEYTASSVGAFARIFKWLTTRSVAIRVSSILIFIGVWQAVAVLLQPELLPAPTTVVMSIWQHSTEGELLDNLSITFGRVAASFSIAMIVGSVIGILMGRFQRVNDWLDAPLTLALNMPVLVTIILCFIWIGLNEVAAIVAVVINKAPNVAVTLREGAKSIDRKLIEVAQVYQVPAGRRLIKVYLPQLYPYFLAAARSGLALVWKIVLVVELMGCSDGVGFQLGSFFQFFDITSVLAYTVAFAAIVYAIEAFVLRPWERSVTRWHA